MNKKITTFKTLLLTMRCCCLIVAMLFAGNSLAQTNGPCANNNDDFPPSIDPAFDYIFDASGGVPDLCLESDGGCVRVTFTNIPTPPPGACPAEISAFIGQGCGGATGNICLFEVTGFEIGAAGGTVSFCAGTSDTYSFIACRPGNGPLAFNNIAVGVPSVAIDSTEICAQDLASGVDLTALIPDGTPTDGTWADAAGNPIANPTAAPIAGKAGTCVDFTYNVADVSQCTGEMCNKIAVAQVCIICCETDFICPADNSLGAFGCNDFASIPACPASPSALGSAPYNVTMGAPCGVWVLDSCTDDITTYDVCVAGGQTVTRTVSVFDDINCNGILDGDEAIVACDFVFTIIEDVTPPTVAGCPMPLSVPCAATDQVAQITAWVATSISAIEAASTDDCGGITVTSDYIGQIPSLACEPTDPGTIITFSVADDCGNISTCTSSAIIINDVIPTITCPADLVGVACLSDVFAGVPVAMAGCGISPDLEISDLILTAGMEGCDGAAYERIYTVTDVCDRTAACTQLITIANDGPTITCPAGGVVECASEIVVGTPTFMTSCDFGAIEVVDGPDIVGTPGCDGTTYTYTHSVTDDCGRTASCVQVFTIQNAGPSITCPTDFVATCITDVVAGTATAELACDETPNIIVAGPTLVAGADGCNGAVYETTYSVTDACDRTAECVQTITIDRPASTISCPADFVATCADEVVAGTATATLSCGETVDIMTAGPTLVSGTVGCNGAIYETTYSFTDECGAFVSCIQTITIDRPASTISCPADFVATCADEVVAGTATATLSCGETVDIMTAGPTLVSGTTGCSGAIYETTYSFTDECNAFVSCTQTITIENSGPTIVCPADFTATCFDDVVAGIAASTTIACGEMPNVQIDGPNLISGTAACNGAVYNTVYSLTDACGRTATCTQTINISNAGPSLACPPDIQISCTESTDPTNTGSAVPSTSCGQGVVSVTFADDSSQSATGCGQYEFVILRLWTMVDDCGQVAECIQTIAVVDQELPVITCPADAALSCTDDTSVAANGMATATDNCSSADELTITFSDVSTQETSGCGQYNYMITRTWTAVDVCGNVGATCDQILTVSDTEGPVTTCPADATVSCDADNSTEATGFATAVDNCADTDTEVTVTLSDETSTQTDTGCGQYNYTITRTFIAQDVCGNFGEPCTQTINVVDETGPAITCPEDAIFSCDEDNSPGVAGMATATDNCATQDEITITWMDDLSNAMGCNNTGVIVRTWTATDVCGNATSCTQNIEIFDEERPVITVGATSMTVECGPDNQAQFDAWLAQNAATIMGTDNCGEPELVFDSNPDFSSVCGIAGAYIVQFQLVDECGNATPTIGAFNIEDNTGPVFTFVPNDTTIDCCDEPNFGTPIAEDACGNGVILTSSDETDMNGSCPNEFSITRTWIAFDNCGNPSSSVSQTIFVEDNTPPVLVPNDPLLVGLESGATLTLDCTNTEVFSPQDFFIGDCCDSDPQIMMMDNTVFSGGCNEDGVVLRMYCIWTGKDACGNTSEFELFLDYVDSTAPTFASFPDDVTVNCNDANGDYGTPTGMDDCSDVTSISSTDSTSGDCTTGGVQITRTWTVEDECGNSSTQNQSILLIDTDGPVFSNVPNNTTAACGTDPVFGEPTATDACSSVASLTSTDTPSNNGCAGSITRTWTATDVCGNTSTASATITFVDDEDPVFANVPTDIQISCTETASFGMPTVSDNCDSDVTINESDETTTNGCSTTQTRTWTATDACGNSASVSQSIVTSDDEAPIISSIPANIEIECGGGTVFDTPTATDNCGAVSLTSTDETLFEGCATGFAIQRTWTATDECGNTSTVSQTANFVDTQAPYFTYVPEDINAGCENADFGVATANDECDNELTLTQEDTESTSGCSTTRTRTWTVTDDCGNSATASQTITTSNDGQAPQINNVGGDLNLGCGETADFSTPSVSDDCFETTLTSSDATTTDGCSTTTTRTWTATDACGNTATAAQSITSINDNEAPVLGDIASDFVGECGVDPAFDTPSVSDNCGDVTLTFEDSANGGTCESGFDITRTWTATDACGNTSTISQTVWVYPTGAESTIAFLFIPPDETIGCNDEMIFGNPIPTSSCEDYEMTFTDETISEEACGNRSVTRTWTATNECDGIATCQQTISVIDNVPPTFTYTPENTSINCEQELAFGTPICEDDCSHNLEVTWEDNIVENCGSSYTMTRTWTATDACGNTTTTSQEIVVNDNIAPTFANVPQDKTVGCGEAFSFDAPTASESCGGTFELTIEDQVSNDDCAVDYSITRTWTATDACGNSANVSQTVTRPADLEAPVFNNLPENKEVACGSNATFNTVEATDNCSNTIVTFEDQTIAGNCEGSYTLERTWTATDNCGNTTSATRSITFSDNIAPAFISTPAGFVIDCNTTPTFGTPVVEDNCNEVELTFNEETSAGDCASGYSITRTWTAIDACGNVATTSQTITISQETTIAFSTIPTNQTISCNDELNFGTPEVTSNCNESVQLNFTEEVIDGTCATSYNVIRTWTANACGVEISASATITVEDDQIPTFEMVPDNKTIACGEALQFDTPLFTDNCSEVTINHTDATSTNNCEVSTTRTWTIADACGNVASASQTITSVDNDAPVFVSTPNDLVINCNTTPTFGTPVVEDNCGEAVLTFNDDTSIGDCSTGYTVTRTWTATDACGNVVTTSQTITIADDTQTSVAFANVPADQLINCDDVIEFGTPEITTNCADEAVLTFEDATTSGSCASSYAVTRTWTATACDIVVTAATTITVEDNLLPTFDMVPDNKTIACGAELQFDTPLYTDNCSEVTLTHTDATDNSTCEVITTRTWTITDACGNTASAAQSISRIDEQSPTIVPFTTISTFNCDQEISIETPTAIDNCNNVTLNYSDEITAGACAGSYSIARTWTATDACGNMASTVQQIEVNDNQAPILLSTPEDFTATCGDNPTFGTPTFEDNCGTLEVTFEDQNSVGDCTTGFEMIRTWTISDGCGNINTTSQTITVEADEDAVLAFISVPMDQTINCDTDLVFDIPTATSTCGEVETTFEDVMLEGNCGNNYSMTRTWTFEDGCENELTTSQTIFVVDEEAPMLLSSPTDYSIACNEEPEFGTPTYNDNCGATEMTFDDNSSVGDCSTGFAITRTWTIVDACGNEITTQQTITVMANTSTSIVFDDSPVDFTVDCGSELLFDTPSAIVNPNCGEINISFEDNTLQGACNNTYSVTRTWTATDDCQNIGIISQTIFVEDNSAPEFATTPQDKVLNCTDQLAFDEMDAFDNCSNISLEFTDEVLSDPNCANAFVQTRTWTATDDCGNISITSQSITVEDNTIPTFISIPQHRTIGCDQNVIFDELEAVDNCGDVTITYLDSNETGDLCPGFEQFTRIWTVSDDCGNTNSVFQTITIEDNNAPEFVDGFEDRFLQCSDVFELSIPQVLDDCSNVTIQFLDEVINDNEDDCTNEMSFKRVWMATDECGNSSTVEQYVYVEDNEAPIFESVDEIFLSEQQFSAWSIPQVNAFDNCSAVTVSGPAESIETGCREITYTYTWFAADNCGNRSEMTTQVHVEKNAGDDCLLISPNPISNGELKVIFEAARDGNSKVQVFDLLGRAVYNATHEVTEGQNKIFLNLNHLSASTYVITVEADNRLHSRKFVKIVR